MSNWRKTTFGVRSECLVCHERIQKDESHYVLIRDRKAPLFKRRRHLDCGPSKATEVDLGIPA